MRHRKHRHQLGVKKEHREALMANLASAFIRHGRIQTTLAKAKALRPFTERLITLAKRAAQTEDVAKKLHLRRQAIARLRDKDAVKQLFDVRVEEFLKREGGYTRIYKLVPRAGDAADMAIIELIAATDEGYTKGRKTPAKKAASKKKAAATESVAEEAVAQEGETVEKAPAAKKKTKAKAAEAPAAKETETEAQPAAESDASAEKSAEGEAEEK